ncbi:MAG: hypothetical protein ACYCZK_05865 [Microbacteriaceae bacterium]
MPFTHVAKYQGRIAADAILGKPHTASYVGIPRVVFGDPEIAAAGLTKEQAAQHGVQTIATELDLANAIARPWTYEQDPRGFLGLPRRYRQQDSRWSVGGGPDGRRVDTSCLPRHPHTDGTALRRRSVAELMELP